MTTLVTGRSIGETIPGEAVGLYPPTAYISALLDFTALMDRRAIENREKKAKETSGPEETISQKIRALSLFPNIYRGPQYQRTFPNIRTDYVDAENYVEDPEEKDVAKVTRRTRRPAKAPAPRPTKKQAETVRSPELLTKKLVKETNTK